MNPSCVPSPFEGTLLQIMPWPFFRKMSDHELGASTNISAPCCVSRGIPRSFHGGLSMSVPELHLKPALPWDPASKHPASESGPQRRPALFAMRHMPARDRLAEQLESGELFRAVVDHQRLACLMVDAGARLFDSSAAGDALLETG